MILFKFSWQQLESKIEVVDNMKSEALDDYNENIESEYGNTDRIVKVETNEKIKVEPGLLAPSQTTNNANSFKKFCVERTDGSYGVSEPVAVVASTPNVSVEVKKSKTAVKVVA